MGRRLLSAILMSMAVISTPAIAQTSANPLPSEKGAPHKVSPEVKALLTAVGLDDLLPILRTEGMAFAESLEGEMFPGRSNARWVAALDRIYDPQRMADIVGRALTERLEPHTIAALMAFFTSERGMRIVELEVAARLALLDDSVQETSRAQFDEMASANDPRVAKLEEFVAVNDLIEMNVAGALNSNLAFSRGLMDGDAYDGAMTEEQILADIWSEEDSIRQETRAWIFGYLALAYQPLTDEDLDAYIAFSTTSEGEAINAALFAGFDAVFSQISLELGRVVARMMAGEDI